MGKDGLVKFKGELDMYINRKLKNKITMILTLLLLISSIPSYGATARFKDVPKKHWSHTYVEHMSKLGYLVGYPDGTFGPDGRLTFMESMSALSRFMNPTDGEVRNAVEKYQALFKELNIRQDWEKQGLSIALDNNIVSENELRNAKKKDLLHRPIQRITTAVFLSRAMKLEEKANSMDIIHVDFKDILSVEAGQRKYLRVLLDAGVIDPQGKGDKKFEPNATLTRAELATLLSKGHDYVEKNPEKPIEKPIVVGSETIKTKIKRITDEIGRNFIVIENRYGDEVGYIIENTTTITVDGKKANVSSLHSGQDVELKIKKGTQELISVEGVSLTQEVEGVIKYISSTDHKMTLEYREGSKTLYEDYSIDTGVKVYRDDKTSYLKDLKIGDIVRLMVKNNVVFHIDARPMDQKQEGIITEIAPVRDSKGEEYYITIVDSKDKSYEFFIDSKTYIYRNNKSARPEDLRVRDEAYIISEYDISKDHYIASEVETKVVVKDIEGYVLGVNNVYNQNTRVTIKNKENDKEETYELARNAYIKIGDVVELSLPTNTGYYAEFTLEGDQITEIYADTSSMEDSIMGTISYINRKDRIIEITIDNIKYDYNDRKIINVYVSKGANIFYKESSKKYDFDQLYKGDRVNIIGTRQGANFVADTIHIR